MSDCSNTAGYDVLRLQADFEGQEFPWMYPLALNGRSIQGVYVDGERYKRAMTCRLELEPNSDRLWWCSNCRSYHEHVSNYPWEHCPRCGARVEEGGDD